MGKKYEMKKYSWCPENFRHLGPINEDSKEENVTIFIPLRPVRIE